MSSCDTLPRDCAPCESATHCVSHSEFWSVDVAGQSTRTALSAWFFDRQPVSVIDSCKGWDCTNH